MPKLPRYKFIYFSAFLFLVLVGVATLYYLSQNGGLDLISNNKKQEAIEASNVIDDPESSLYASCTHEKMPYIRISKGSEQIDFDAVVTYATTEDFANSIQVEIPAGEQFVDINLPTAKVKSQQIYSKVMYKAADQEATDDVATLRVDPCPETTEVPNDN